MKKLINNLKKCRCISFALTAVLVISMAFSEQAFAFQPIASEVPSFKEYDITLMAVGDNLLHMGIVQTGMQADGSRNYDVLFDGINGFLEKADIKVINQETILGGNDLGFSGYPRFNSPTEVGDSIAKAGFNVVLHASNHTADQGLNGMAGCLSFWQSHPEVLVAGLHEPIPAEEQQSRIPLLQINDRTFAILNYTYGPNSESIPAQYAERLDMLCAVNDGMIDFTSLNPQVIADIQEADKLADAVIVFPHWGTEYTTTPSPYQENFAMQMAEAGADVIIGTHPHVVQPIQWVEAANGNRALCYYSLGNYVSTQKGALSMLEGLAWVTFRVAGDGSVSVSEPDTGVVPLVCHYASGPGFYPFCPCSPSLPTQVRAVSSAPILYFPRCRLDLLPTLGTIITWAMHA